MSDETTWLQDAHAHIEKLDDAGRSNVMTAAGHLIWATTLRELPPEAGTLHRITLAVAPNGQVEVSAEVIEPLETVAAELVEAPEQAAS